MYDVALLLLLLILCCYCKYIIALSLEGFIVALPSLCTLQYHAVG